MIGIRLVLAVLITATFAGCAPSLEAARARSPEPTVGAAAARDDARCRRLSRNESVLRYVSVGSAVLGGGSGLATIPVDDPDAQTALAISAAGFGVVAGTSEAVRAEIGADWARECAE